MKCSSIYTTYFFSTFSSSGRIFLAKASTHGVYIGLNNTSNSLMSVADSTRVISK